MDHGTSLLKGGTKLIYRKFYLKENQFKTCTCSTIWCKNRNIVRHPSKKPKSWVTLQSTVSKFQNPLVPVSFIQHLMGVHFRLSTCQPTLSNMHADVCLWLLQKKIHHLLPIGVSIFSNIKGVDGERERILLWNYTNTVVVL